MSVGNLESRSSVLVFQIRLGFRAGVSAETGDDKDYEEKKEWIVDLLERRYSCWMV